MVSPVVSPLRTSDTWLHPRISPPTVRPSTPFVGRSCGKAGRDEKRRRSRSRGSMQCSRKAEVHVSDSFFNKKLQVSDMMTAAQFLLNP